jgi:hypothetical protein
MLKLTFWPCPILAMLKLTFLTTPPSSHAETDFLIMPLYNHARIGFFDHAFFSMLKLTFLSTPRFHHPTLLQLVSKLFNSCYQMRLVASGLGMQNTLQSVFGYFFTIVFVLQFSDILQDNFFYFWIFGFVSHFSDIFSDIVGRFYGEICPKFGSLFCLFFRGDKIVISFVTSCFQSDKFVIECDQVDKREPAGAWVTN